MWLKKIHIKYIASLIILYSSMATLAQAPRKFYMRFGGNGYDVGYDVKQTLDNGYIITGSTSSFGQGNTDLYLVKLDSMGNKKFEKSFGSYNNEIGKSVLQLFDSSYVAVGYTNSTGFGGYDIFLVKTDKNGNLLWEKTIGGSDWDFAYSLQATNDGGFVIAGTTYSYGRGNADGYVVKTDGSGNVVWTKTYGGAYDDEFKSVVQTADGGFALTGYTKSYNDIDSGDVWVFKLDNMGDSTWCKFFGGGKEDFGNEIIQHPSTELYIVGGTRSYSANPNYMSAYAIRLLIDGSFNSDRIDNTSTTDQIFNSIVVSKRASNFYVNTISYFTVGGYQKQVKVLEMDFGLNYANAVGVGSILDDELYKIIITKDKGYACVGFTQGDGAILEDGYFIKFDSLLNYGSFSTVSVNEITEPEIMFSVFPNPVNQEFTIMSGDNIKFKKIQLFDCIGREINLSNRIQHVSGNQLKINVEDIPSGAYQLILDRKSDKLIILH